MNWFQFFFVLAMLNVCVFGIPMKKQEEPKYIALNKAQIDQHAQDESRALSHAKYLARDHALEKSKKSFINPMKYHHLVEEHQARKDGTFHYHNIVELSKAKNTGYVRMMKSKSGRKDRFTAIEKEIYDKYNPTSQDHASSSSS